MHLGKQSLQGRFNIMVVACLSAYVSIEDFTPVVEGSLSMKQ